MLAKSETERGSDNMGRTMAANGDLKPHEQTYTGFTSWVKWGTIAVAIVTVIVVFVIAR